MDVGCALAHHLFCNGVLKHTLRRCIVACVAQTHILDAMIEHDLQYAIELARAAGKIVLENYGKVERLTKTHIAASEEAVTEADRAAQRIIVAGLKKRFPTDGIIGEESDTGAIDHLRHDRSQWPQLGDRSDRRHEQLHLRAG